MPRINLLPIKAAQRQVSARNELFAMAALVAATVVVLFLWYTSVESEVAELQERLHAIDRDIKVLTDEVKQVESLKVKEETVQQKLALINGLMAGRTGPAKMLYDLANILTELRQRVWLSRLQHKETGELTLQGFAVDHEDISEFQLALERKGAIKKIVLKQVNSVPAKPPVPEHLSWEISAFWLPQGDS